MAIIELEWEGPFNSKEVEDGCARANPGLYLWVVGQKPDYLLSYVGESGDVRDRLWRHHSDLRNGRSWLYEIDRLELGDVRDGIYDPSTDRDKFLEDPTEYSQIIRENLDAYSIFCSYHKVLELSTARKKVESQLISDADYLFGLRVSTQSNLRDPNIKRFIQNTDVGETYGPVHSSCPSSPRINIRGVQGL